MSRNRIIHLTITVLLIGLGILGVLEHLGAVRW